MCARLRMQCMLVCRSLGRSTKHPDNVTNLKRFIYRQFHDEDLSCPIRSSSSCNIREVLLWIEVTLLSAGVSALAAGTIDEDATLRFLFLLTRLGADVVLYTAGLVLPCSLATSSPLFVVVEFLK